MGNQECSSSEIDQAQIQTDKQMQTVDSNLLFIQNIDSLSYGEAKLIKDRLLGSFQVVKLSVFDNQMDCQRYINQQEQKLNFDCIHLIKLNQVRKQKNQQLCSKFYKVYISFDYIQFNLRDQMDCKIKKSKQFCEDSIIKLLLSVLQALQYMYKKGITHENIMPQTILYDKNNQDYKITDAKFLTGNTIYNKFLMSSINEKTCSYLSPEQLYFLKRREQNPNYNKEKSDIFSLGLCALEAGTQQSVSTIFDFDQFIINENSLENKLKIFKKFYSSQLYKLVSQMLLIQVCERINIQESNQQVINFQANFQQNQDSLMNTTNIVSTQYKNQPFAQIPIKSSHRTDKYNQLITISQISDINCQEQNEFIEKSYDQLNDIENDPICHKLDQVKTQNAHQEKQKQKKLDSLRQVVSTLEDQIENIDIKYQFHLNKQKYSQYFQNDQPIKNSQMSKSQFKNELTVNMDAITFRLTKPFR